MLWAYNLDLDLVFMSNAACDMSLSSCQAYSTRSCQSPLSGAKVVASPCYEHLVVDDITSYL